MVDDEMNKITSEQVGVLKTIKIALEMKRFYEQLESEGRDTFRAIGEKILSIRRR